MNAPCSILALATCLIFAGCHNQPATPSATTADTQPAPAKLPPPAQPVDPAQAATITGVVSFKGTPPKPVKIDMSMDPACSMAPGDNMSEQYVVSHGGIANVFVYLKRAAGSTSLAPSSAPAGAPPVNVDQRACKFIPHVVAIQQGGKVAFSNSDPTMHNVHTMAVAVGNTNVDVSQGPGAAPQVREFNTPENMLPVRCNNHPWMNAFVNVAPNPYFTVSGVNGTFRISGVPPGKYILAAVHEKLGEQDVEVDVSPHGTAKTELVFGPQ